MFMLLQDINRYLKPKLIITILVLFIIQIYLKGTNIFLLRLVDISVVFYLAQYYKSANKYFLWGFLLFSIIEFYLFQTIGLMYLLINLSLMFFGSLGSYLGDTRVGSYVWIIVCLLTTLIVKFVYYQVLYNHTYSLIEIGLSAQIELIIILIINSLI